MSEEIEAIADEMDEDFVDEPAGEDADERKSHGPGLRLGIFVGLIAGAVVATLFAPPTGEETPGDQVPEELAEGSGASPPDPDAPMARVRSLLDQVRARIREASREAEIATRETEELAHAHYAELTQKEGKKT